MRTTIDIDDPILEDLRRLQREQGKPLGRLVSDLLAQALAKSRKPPPMPKFKWIARPLGARVDLGDKDIVRDAMDDDRG